MKYQIFSCSDFTMISVSALLQRLSEDKIYLQIDGDKLRISAPQGAVNSELIDILRKRKQEIIAVLTPSGIIRPPCGYDPQHPDIERWLGKTSHWDKWIFCLTAATVAA
jgi:hypothetical protein